jgi:nucleoside 2-deoxyribosyltransferase
MRKGRYFSAAESAVTECGYAPRCLKEIGNNDNICDLFLSEIRQAQFLVADFTRLKAGVYFEAGFAKALGKEVFWTCRSDDIRNLHFDTNHYGHIEWTTKEDLRRKLRERIMAVLGRGPHPPLPQ